METSKFNDVMNELICRDKCLFSSTQSEMWLRELYDAIQRRDVILFFSLGLRVYFLSSFPFSEIGFKCFLKLSMQFFQGEIIAKNNLAH